MHRRLANRVGFSAAAVWLILAMLLVGYRAAAGDTNASDPHVPASVPELLDLFGVANTPVDFVVVVDTSGSMQDGPDPLYPKVVTAYQQFVAATRPNDYLSVLTFDTVANLVFAGRLDEPGAKDRATNALPLAAQGQHTDIGSGLDGALSRLERPNANEVEIVFFLTDGVHEPGVGTPFPSTTGPAWDSLHDRGVTLERGHRVFAYGAGVTSGQPTNVGLVRGVFSHTQIESLPPEQLGRGFQEAVDRGRVELLRRPISEEVQKADSNVRVVPDGELGDPLHFNATVSCGAKKLPCEFDVKGVKVLDSAGKPVPASLVDGRQTLLVAPGGVSKAVAVDAHPELTDPGWRQIGTIPQTQPYTVTLDVRTILQPKELINRSVDLDTTIQTAQQVDSVPFTREVGLSMRRFLFLLACFVVFLLVVGFILQRLFALPPLRGGIQLPDGTVVRFTGKTQRFPDRKHQSAETYGSVAIFFTKRRKWRKVFVRSKTGTVEVKHGDLYRVVKGDERIPTATRMKIGNLDVIYTSKRRSSPPAAGPAPKAGATSGTSSSKGASTWP